MSIPKSKLVQVYSRLSLNRDLHLKEVYFRQFAAWAISLNLDFPGSLYFLNEVEKSSMQALRKHLLRRSPFSVLQYSIFIMGLLTESVVSLEKSVHWFYAYRLSQRAGFRVAAAQARYYSEFFALIGLSRFLGMAVTHLPRFGKLQLLVNWNNSEFEIIVPGRGVGEHVDQYNLLRTNITSFDFLESDVTNTIGQGNRLLLTEDRIRSVYEFGRQGHPFFLAGPSPGVPCFLGGEQGIGINMNCPADPSDQERYYEYIHERYGDGGYYDDGIGAYQKQLIILLRGLSVASVNVSLDQMRAKVTQMLEIEDYEKADLLEWLS